MRYADGSWHRPDAFVCVKDVAQGPPALGAEAPERFRA